MTDLPNRLRSWADAGKPPKYQQPDGSWKSLALEAAERIEGLERFAEALCKSMWERPPTPDELFNILTEGEPHDSSWRQLAEEWLRRDD